MTTPSLDHVLVVVREIERARYFYRDVLELAEVERPVFPYPGLWFQLADGKILHLVVREEGGPRGDKALDIYDLHFALRVTSYRETLAWLQAKGFRDGLADGDPHKLVLRPDSPTGRPQIYLMDPDNNTVEFICDNLEADAVKTVAKMEIPFHGVEHTGIASPNTQALAEWYVEYLNFRIVFSYNGNYFVRAPNGSLLEIIPADNELAAPQVMANNKDAGIRHLAIIVDDFDKAYESLKRRDVHFLIEPFVVAGNRLVFFNDADGNLLHLIKRGQPLP